MNTDIMQFIYIYISINVQDVHGKRLFRLEEIRKKNVISYTYLYCLDA